MTAAALLILRVGASVSLAVLLTLTTRWNTLIKALGVLRIPPVFLSVLEMTYRYIFLLLSTSSDMFMARRSRLVGRVGPEEERGSSLQPWEASGAKTAALSEEVHGAMLSRGYAGMPRSVLRFRMKPSDWAWIFLVLVAAVLFIGGDRVLG